MLPGIQGEVLPEHPFCHTGIIFDLCAFLAGEVVAVVPVFVQADLAGPVYGSFAIAAQQGQLPYPFPISG
ncbi:MAG: hypothetical protein ACLFQO_16740 [Cyclobacteriaceae bacterium]